jgi:adenylate cyclase
MRNLVRPFKNGIFTQAAPMADIFKELNEQLQELALLKTNADFAMADA